MLLVGCGLGAFAACGGGNEEGGGFSVDDAGKLGNGKGGKGGGAGSSAGAGAGGGLLGGSAGAGGGINVGGTGNVEKKLSIKPAAVTLTIKDKSKPVSQVFEAFLEGDPKPVAVTWALSSYNLGGIDAKGAFTTSGIQGGSIDVSATLGAQTVKAKLDVKVELSEVIKQGGSDPGPSPQNSGALDQPPQADAGEASKILYPYSGTVFPRGLIAPIVQFSPGATPPEDAKITLSSGLFSWSGKMHVQNAGLPQLAVPQDIWDAALQSAGGQKIQVAVTKAAGGKAYGPAKTEIVAATASLKGAVYYMTYHEPVGLYSVRPGVKEPAKQIVSGCVVCHSVSANGTRLSTGAETDDSAPDFAKSGVYQVGADGSASQLSQSPGGLGGDSRGLSYATWTPDGRYVMRSQSNFWGGINQKAWRFDDTSKQLVEAKVVGLGDQISALVPTISPDGKRYAFTNGSATPALGSASRSISVMDLSIDPKTDTLTFSSRQTVLDNGGGGAVTKFAAFLPDANLLVLQEGEGYQSNYEQMLPSWDSNSTYKGSTGRLHLVRIDTKEHLELLNANQGNAEIDRQRNYEPFVLPVAAGGYYWVVFTSIREYGNTYQGENVRKQLWVAALSTNAKPGEDPSHPPFYLPNQTDTPNERGFWALEPCKVSDKPCETGDECCGGFCRPSDPKNPSSPRVCKDTPSGDPGGGMCAQTSEKCAVTADCCNASAGIKCINGFCTEPTPDID